MILIIGGAYQGKYDFALNTLGLKEENILNSFHMLTKRMLAKYAGSWKDNRDSDEINDDIYASRLSRKEENFSPFDE